MHSLRYPNISANIWAGAQNVQSQCRIWILTQVYVYSVISNSTRISGKFPRVWVLNRCPDTWIKQLPDLYWQHWTVVRARRISNAFIRDVTGDPHALRDSLGVLRVLGAVAHNQYVVHLRAQPGVHRGRQHWHQPGAAVGLCLQLLQPHHVLLHEPKISPGVPWALQLPPLLEVIQRTTVTPRLQFSRLSSFRLTKARG